MLYSMKQAHAEGKSFQAKGYTEVVLWQYSKQSVVGPATHLFDPLTTNLVTKSNQHQMDHWAGQRAKSTKCVLWYEKYRCKVIYVQNEWKITQFSNTVVYFHLVLVQPITSEVGVAEEIKTHQLDKTLGLLSCFSSEESSDIWTPELSRAFKRLCIAKCPLFLPGFYMHGQCQTFSLLCLEFGCLYHSYFLPSLLNYSFCASNNL